MKFIIAALFCFSLTAQASKPYFNKVGEDATSVTYTFKDWGPFKASKATFATRAEAAAFCDANAGYSMPSLIFPYFA